MLTMQVFLMRYTKKQKEMLGKRQGLWLAMIDFTMFSGNPLNRHWDISVWVKVVDWLMLPYVSLAASMAQKRQALMWGS